VSERLVIRGVHKSFGPTAALAGVDLAASAGEVHAIIGENGAGKSTLMKILSGELRPDAGEVLFEGAPFSPDGPRSARAAGVSMVHQELSLCPHLTVTENVLLGEEPSRLGVLSWRAMHAKVAEILKPIVGVSRIDPRARVGDLSPPDRQLVEIARALSHEKCQVLILDEPTSSLGADDVRRLFEILRGLRGRGIAVLYISHFLEEVEQIADRFTVLRDGRTVGSGPIGQVPLDEIVTMMAGRKIEALFPRSARTPGEVVLEVDALAGAKKPQFASLSLRRGEVVGIAGLIGAGRTELMRAIFALDPVVSGTVKVAGFVGPASPARRLAQGVGLLSEDRKGEGLAVALSLVDNLTLSKMPAFVSPRRARAATQRWIDRLSVRCRDPEQPVSDLSGGNQQKIALGRLLHHDVDVLLLDEPTRGIDVGSKAQIYALIDELASKGEKRKAVLMVSSYLPELLGVCDRIAVMTRGRLGKARPIAECDERAILAEATGA
jgi:ribose transport system ATP-binding protein